MKVGGLWAAQAGYALKRTGETELAVLCVAGTQHAREALERMKKACELMGVEVKSVSDVLGFLDVPSCTTCWNCGLEQNVIVVMEGWAARCRRCGRLLSSPQRRSQAGERRKVMIAA